ncbi:MAG: hypothetical protein AAFW69_04610 [Pseudomonadota bacterium]
MGRLVLHIGMHKTGTTAIQHALAVHRPLLAALGIDYYRPPGPGGRPLPKANDLFAAISAEKDGRGPDPVHGPSAPLVSALAARVAAARGPVVVSAEGLSGEDPAFARALAPLAAPQTRVIVALRRPDAWAESFYAQMVMSREVAEWRSFPDWLVLPSTAVHLDYEALLGWWAEAFGAQALRVLAYRPERDPLPGFLAAAGLPRWLAASPLARGRRNPAPGRAALIARRVENGGAEAGATGFGADARAAFLAARAPALERIRARWRPDLVQLFPEPGLRG